MMKSILIGFIAGFAGFLLSYRIHERITSNAALIPRLQTDFNISTLSPTFPSSPYATSLPPRVFCWVPSRDSKGPLLEAIVKTWISSCDGFMFSSTESNPSLHVVKIEYPRDQSLWNMIHPAWSYVEKHYIDQYDWFVKLDDDSYFCAPNFKHLVRDYDPNDFYYMGHTVHEQGKRVDNPQALFNLGAGHALSRGSLRRMAKHLPNSDSPDKAPPEQQCPKTYTWAEDVMLGECLHKAGGIGHPNNSRDEWGRENFMAFTPESNFLTVRRPDSSSWFWKEKPKNVGSGVSCCSSRPIGFHGFEKGHTKHIFALQYMLYNVNVDPMPPSSSSPEQ